jgi:hypothetical protein
MVVRRLRSRAPVSRPHHADQVAAGPGLQPNLPRTSVISSSEALQFQPRLSTSFTSPSTVRGPMAARQMPGAALRRPARLIRRQLAAVRLADWPPAVRRTGQPLRRFRMDRFRLHSCRPPTCASARTAVTPGATARNTPFRNRLYDTSSTSPTTTMRNWNLSRKTVDPSPSPFGRTFPLRPQPQDTAATRLPGSQSQ